MRSGLGVDPAMVGDESNNGGANLSAFDTSLIAQESAGINTPEATGSSLKLLAVRYSKIEGRKAGEKLVQGTHVSESDDRSKPALMAGSTPAGLQHGY